MNIFQHNTEFSPKICETCKCRDGLIECLNTCSNNQNSNEIKHKKKSKDLCMINGELVKCKYNNDICIYDDYEYKNNTIWSPIPCTNCKCENGNVNCYVIQCSPIDCPNVSLFYLLTYFTIP